MTKMKATTTANTTPKYYSKTKLQNNNHQQNKISSTTNKKSIQQTTYPEAKEAIEAFTQMVETTPTKKLTAKQTKAAGKLAAQQQQNAKSCIYVQQQRNEVSRKIMPEKEAKLNVTNIPATCTKLNTTAINVNSTLRCTHSASAVNNNSIDRNSNNNLNKNNSNKNNNNSIVNTSDNSLNISIRYQTQQEKQHLQSQQQEKNSKRDSQQQEMSDNNTTSTMSWNNSKYLHKKFKRLASTTENDVLQETEKLRTTSLSSASSSVSPPPPSTTNEQQRQHQQQQEQQQSILPIPCDEHLTNETQQILKDHYCTNDDNNFNSYRQNQGFHQLALQQHQLPQEQVYVFPSALETSQVNTNTTTNIVSNANVNSISIATVPANSSTTAGGRYKCPYCDISCTKPSVLQKHIRAHTNERPYPCEMCGIAFKTKSNLYKHCRSRSHAARQKGIEVSPDADDGLSDQDVDPELSNSSCEMLCLPESPIDELTNTIITQQQTRPQQNCVLSASTNSTSILPASGISAKPIYLQQQSQKFPFDSPAIGIVPPASVATVSPVSFKNNAATCSQKQDSLEYKPYKPKFHNAALYATAKEAAAASDASKNSPEAIALIQNSSTVPPKDMSVIHKLAESPYKTINHYQQLAVVSESDIVVPSSANLPPTSHQSLNHLPHNPPLSSSIQMKLNNHISSHQFQQMQSHLLGPPPTNSLSLPLAAPTFYLSHPPGASPSNLLHPSPHLPAQSFYNTFFPTLHMTPQQQQFHHQLQLQQQHLQERQMVIAHCNRLATIPPPPPSTQSVISQASPSIPQNNSKTTNPMTNTSHISMSSNNSRIIHQSKISSSPSANTTVAHPTPQNPLHYLVATANTPSISLNPQIPTDNKNNTELIEQTANISNLRMPSNISNIVNANTLVQTSVNTGLQEVTLNKEKLNEHINKLISQNEAIVENKELLLQKKYPKTLNRSRSFTNNSNSINSSTNLQTTTGGAPSESPTNAKLAQAIVQKQQLQQQQLQQQYIYQQQQQPQQQQQHMHKQKHLYQEKLIVEESSPILQPLNGISKHGVTKHIVQSQQVHTSVVVPVTSYQTQYLPYRTIVTITPTQQQSHSSTILSSTNTSAIHSQLGNVPLNLSAKMKSSDESIELNRQSQGLLPQAPLPSTPRKRHSIEQVHSGHTQLPTPNLMINETSNSSNSNSSTPQPSTSSGKYPSNNSIIKNLLLNARGLAVPIGTGDDVVYICPLCSLECRTAEELKLHNSTYCQGSNSCANSPASSPSQKYFRSSPMSLNMPDFKILSKNPLSLAKLAWSQLKTKPSNLVLNRLSASVANTSKNSSSNTTTSPSTQPASGSSVLHIVTEPKSIRPVNEIQIRFVDAPLPSPGPLLGKTPLVDYTLNESKSKSEEVIITKMHDDHMYTHDNMPEHTASKRSKFEFLDKFSRKNLSLNSGGEMQLLSIEELSKKEERYKRFTSSGGSIIPLSECDDVDKSPKMIRTPLLSGGSFQEVSPKKETKMSVQLMPGTQLPPKQSLGLACSKGPQHFQFPPINQITAFNPLTLGLTEKIIPYVPGIPGPNSLQPQLPLAPPTKSLQQKQQHLLNVLPCLNGKQSLRTSSPNKNQTPSPMNMSTSIQIVNNEVNTPSFCGVQNIPSEFNRAPSSSNMRNVRNWQAKGPTLTNVVANSNTTNIKNIAAVNDSEKSPKSFNFMRMAENLCPRKSSNCNEAKLLNSSSQLDSETRHFSLDKISREQLVIQQPLNNISKTLSPTNLALTPLHVETNVTTDPNDIECSSSESKTKSKFLRPTTLPLRPGTFTLKRHHGITPTANTLPLISPETPRPSKECVQLYLNGNSYTYLGLKCSTKTFYCTLNCPQPSYVQDMHKLSMYSMWQQCAENNPHPLGLKPKEVMSLYDSRQKALIFTMAKRKKIAYSVVDAQATVMTPFITARDKCYHHQLKPISLNDTMYTKDNKKTSSEYKAENSKDIERAPSASNSITTSQALEGGYESHENYIYVRGRGRGKYVCSECGIRCKKPSMLKKHIRTHTDVRPYTCKHCNFSFKTKGNLTKHMQSKTHYKKCIELGLNPGPMPADGEFLEPDVEFDQQSSTSGGGRTSSIGNGESDSDGDSSDNETESSNESDSPARYNVTQNFNVSTAEDNKSHLEHEAARCLLTLSMTPPIYNQSFETSVANSQIASATVVSTCSNVSSAAMSAVRRVISYTSPKPPFDYQKQEQYYSNPKEPKLKMNNSSISNFETTPMDLTKPRANDVVPAPNIPQSTTTPFSSNPGPIQTQAQIRDVIFGVNKSESGFLKTMISVSSKVGRNYADNYEENHHTLNEDMMLYDYRREQTLQYYKIKQKQLTRGITVNPDVIMSNSTPTATTCLLTTTYSNTINASVSTISSAINEQSTTTNEVTTTSFEISKILVAKPEQPQKIDLPVPIPIAVTTTAAVSSVLSSEDVPYSKPKSFKSSDESEETDEEPPPKKLAVRSDEKPAHNSNLPAAILQPGTTDFSGVLSAGVTNSQLNNSNQPTRTVIVGEDGFTTNNNEILPVHQRVPQIAKADGRPVCSICLKTFQKHSQLLLHTNIHYMERKYKCDACAVSFRTHGHLQKHERSEGHKNKVIMTSTFGVPTTSNPRPFECTDCKIAFRIHGHLAKHLRSKTHVQKLECLQKLPFGTYAEIERAGISLTEIDTSDCENSLISLRVLAQKLIEKDPASKLGSYTTPSEDNSNTGLVSQDSASEDGFTAAERAAATAIASLENNSAENTPQRANSTSEDESIVISLNNNLKRCLPITYSNSEEGDKEFQEQEQQEKRLRSEAIGNYNSRLSTSSPTN